MIRLQLRTVLVAFGLLASPFALVRSQTGDARRAEATREELEAGLAEIEQILASPGYSGRLKDAKRTEAELIKRRLTEGDFQAGDQITLVVVGEASLTGPFMVRSGQQLVLPQLPEVSLHGVLRSELRTYLTKELGKYIRDPQVDATPTGIRLVVLGAVGRPGFATVPADQLVSDAISMAGGPLPSADIFKTVIRRGGKEIVAEEEVRDAIVMGRTLDQLNLYAGDELYVPPQKGSIGWSAIRTTLQVVTGLGFAVYSLSRIF